MSRSRHLDLDTSDDAVILGAGARARHRAAVEEQLAGSVVHDRAVRASSRAGVSVPRVGRGPAIPVYSSTMREQPGCSTENDG